MTGKRLPISERDDNDGKWLEAEMEVGFARAKERVGAFYHRFTDSYAARSTVKKAPADYLFVWCGKNWLIEAKSTVIGTNIFTMAASSKSHHQLATQRIWMMAGNLSVYVHANLRDGVCDVWAGGAVVLGAYDVKARKTLRPLFTFPCSRIRDEFPEVLFNG